MDAIFLPGRVDRESEFVGGLTGACGPNASAMAQRWADQSHLTTLDVYHRMRAAGRCDPNGASTLSALADDARAAGYNVALLSFQQPMPAGSWRDFFQRHVGRQAIVFETANGQALRDTLTGKGENATNLHYHFVMVAGWHPGGHSDRAGRDLPAGWWCADGDNYDSGDVLQFYEDGILAASQPSGALAIAARVAFDEIGADPVGIPNNWHDDGATLTAPNGVPVVKGFRDWVLTHPWSADDWPLAPEAGLPSVEPGNPSIGAGTRQDFRMTSLGWTPTRGVYRIWTGQDLLALQSELTTARSQLSSLQSQLASVHSADPDVQAIKALAAALATVKS